MGSFINGLSIFVCAVLGFVIKSRLKEKYTDAVSKGVSVAIVFVGASGALKNMALEDAHPFLFIVCIALGGILGAWLNISDRLTAFGDFVQAKFAKNSGDFSKGFVYATILFCTGAMSIIGSFESGVSGDNSILITKSVIDGVMSLVLGSTMGLGVSASGFSVIAYEGTLTAVSSFVADYITEDMFREISIVGNILISCIGLDLLDILKIKVADYLPAAFLPVLYYLIIS